MKRWLAACLLLLCAPVAQADATLRHLYQGPVDHWPTPWVDAGVAFVELGALPAPAPARGEAARSAREGERLFHDPRLSADGRVSCATCHAPTQAFTVRTPLATGVHGRVGTRNPPSLLEIAHRRHWAWDGAAPSLQAQSLRPITHPHEMGRVQARIPGLPAPARIGAALAAYQRGLHRVSDFDRFMQGEHGALSDAAVQGLHLFRTRARCVNCHVGPTLSDGRFHNLGIAFFGEPSQDLGRHAVTGACTDVGAFRTPSLRHVSQTAPYMHHGLFDSLRGVIALYARGGGETRARPSAQQDPLYACAQQRSPLLRPLDLSEQDIEALLAFLRSL